jgi:hypothetical protein
MCSEAPAEALRVIGDRGALGRRVKVREGVIISRSS